MHAFSFLNVELRGYGSNDMQAHTAVRCESLQRSQDSIVKCESLQRSQDSIVKTECIPDLF